jgi:hypothetical protein
MKKAIRLLLISGCLSGLSPAVDFNREIRPILAANCYACHGPDEESREARLRLDTSEGAREVVTPPGDAELVRRIVSDDEEEVMPPPDSGSSLSKREIALLKDWVAEGAKYETHWSFRKPVKSPVPAGLHPVDHFVSGKLKEAGLEMSPPSDRYTLIRRLSLDLTGLPPSLEMADEFVAKGNLDEMVDRLLASPAFGEHWARMWLDLARYADTKGYEKDRARTIWRYRDWVIEALNADMPYDQFTRDQLAGDLVPNATGDQLLATAFHRNTMENDEGGTDDEEFRVAAVKDRVDTTMQVWMGITMGCAKCHTHKYDPISIEDYYSFYALFNQTEDADRGAPVIPTPTKEQQTRVEELEKMIAELEEKRKVTPEGFEKALSSWRSRFESDPLWRSVILTDQKTGGIRVAQDEKGRLSSIGELPEKDTWVLTFELPAEKASTALRLALFPKKPGGKWPSRNVALREIKAAWIGDDGKVSPVRLLNPRADFGQKGWEVNRAVDGRPRVGWALAPKEGDPHVAIFDFEKPLQGGKLRLTLDQQHGQGMVLRDFKVSVSSHSANWLEPQLDPSSGLAQVFRKRVFGPTKEVFDRQAEARTELASIRRSIPTTPIMRELPEGKQRVTRIHRRGNFLDQGEEVAPGLPKVFGGFPDGAAANRLGVAEWLTDAENPLTARVMVNRVWARVFGKGIVETEEDFGMQGKMPVHPRLLDWLAVDYRENGWSLKKLLKTMVRSKTYQQTSVVSSDRLNRDPRNELLSRGPRFRLTAEMVRDQALKASGLLTTKLGGPSVMPPQPSGIWKSTYSGDRWKDAAGPDRYRRGLYTYLKRTSPYPSMMTFDAGSGEVCQIRRVRTNTPLQALVTLNDPVFLEAAGALSKRMKDVAHGFRLVMIRPPKDRELRRLEDLRRTMGEHYRADPAAAKALLASAGLSEGDAALVAVANVLLNLDEALMKP